LTHRCRGSSNAVIGRWHHDNFFVTERNPISSDPLDIKI
jgi:hypothetical protein